MPPAAPRTADQSIVLLSSRSSRSWSFVPDRGVAWPRADLTNPLYRAQINNLLSNMAGMGEMAQHEH